MQKSQISQLYGLYGRVPVLFFFSGHSSENLQFWGSGVIEQVFCH